MDGQKVSTHSRVSSINNGSATTAIESQLHSNPILLLPNFSTSNTNTNSWLNKDWTNIGSIAIVGYQLWVIESK